MPSECGPYLPTVIGHRAESAEGRDFHDDIDDAEDAMRHIVDKGEQGLAARAERHQGEAEQNGEQQHLEDIALGESADDAVRDDVENKIDGFMRRCLLLVADHRRFVAMSAEA